jgi:hypothetical protein
MIFFGEMKIYAELCRIRFNLKSCIYETHHIDKIFCGNRLIIINHSISQIFGYI